MDKEFMGLSNSQLKVRLKEIEDEFEREKMEINEKIKKMNELSLLYNECNKLFLKRTKGIF